MEQILPLPVKFDANEWFILLTIGLGYTLVSFLPKRYPRAISILTALFTSSAAIIIDHAIAEQPLDWYDINDRKEYELMDVFTYFMYAPYGLLCIYLYDKFNPKRLMFAAFIVAWSLFSVGFEWISVKCHVFQEYQWNLVCSFSLYLVATTVQLRLFQFLFKHYNKTKTKPSKGS